MKQVNKTIAMVISVPFPTPKAYGVTTRETLLSLKVLGYEPKIFTIRGPYTDLDYSEVQDLIFPLPQDILYRFLIVLSRMGKGRVHFIFWRFAVIESYLRIFLKLRALDPKIIWLRDPSLAFISQKLFPRIKIILEVHDFSSGYFLKKLIQNQKNVILFPINKIIYEFISNLNPRAVMKIAPMGIRQENIATEIQIQQFVHKLYDSTDKVIKIGYVGGMAPGGYSKGVEDLILLAEFNMKNNFDAEVILVGANNSELSKFKLIQKSLGIKDRFLNVYPHVSHTEAIKLLHSIDILVLPIPRSDNYVGMPIKLLEYIAAGKIVIVADCNLFRSFFNENYVPFYYKSENVASLSSEINRAKFDNNLLSKLLNGINFVSDFTWQTRTKNMIKFTDDKF
jgi:glycosyltransferase involved in cell wall biosynthesis